MSLLSFASPVVFDLPARPEDIAYGYSGRRLGTIHMSDLREQAAGAANAIKGETLSAVTAAGGTESDRRNGPGLTASNTYR
jgi:hypothetical protein